jgi:hypothetical protein
LPYSDTGKYKIRVSIRQGRVLPQRTKITEVSEF